ncbi:MAG TPA: WYL domain-containing protein [Acidimicrobiales bacterium]|nr:WYL domain-containing protein [Acidimicrobiales bacterium]
MSAAKLERLLNLTALLLNTPRPLSAQEIRDRIEAYPPDLAAFRRAFERDKDALRAMGFPLEVAEVPGTAHPVDGYRIPKDRYYLRDPGLTPEELAALRLASTVVRLEGVGSSADEGLLKLGGLVGDTAGPDGPDGPAGLGGGPGLAVAALPGAPDLGPLFGAIASQTPVRFAYRGEDRTVDPYRLDYRRGRWYLSGFDHLRAAERLYRLDRFESRIEALAGPRFERPSTSVPGGQLEPWQLGEGDPIEALVLVDAPQAPWVAQHLGREAVVEERPDGAVVVTMTVTNRDNFRSFVLTFLEHAEVLAPPEVRADVVRWLGALAGSGTAA